MNILKSRFNAETFADYIHQRLSVFLKFSLSVGALLMFFQGRYQAMAEILLILFITFLPIILGKRFDVRIPHGFETLAVIFLYMSLFLGETQSYYTRFWWWDLVLHSGSAFLLGILGLPDGLCAERKKGGRSGYEAQVHSSVCLLVCSQYWSPLGNF